MNIEPYVLRFAALFFSLVSCLSGAAQSRPTLHLAPELLTGISNDSNTGFPERSPQFGVGAYIGRNWEHSGKEWAQRLNSPRSGLLLSYLDFGNSEKIGHAFGVMPFIEIPISGSEKKEWAINAAFGAAYIDRLHDEQTNPLNKAISTYWNWSYKAGILRSIYTQRADWRIGIGYMHQSNGHTRLPNQGINSFQLMLSMILPQGSGRPPVWGEQAATGWRNKSDPVTFFSMRGGLGMNILSLQDNEHQPVQTFAFSVGRRVNRAWSYDMGFYLRHYDHYQDYIEGVQNAVDTLYPFFRENSFGYASAYGFHAHGELYLGRVGIELGMGLNIYKPAYKLDWQLNEGEVKEGVYEYGELDWYYEVKRTFSSRMGLKLYAWPLDMDRRHNFFVAGHINANLGQADFSEASLGYVIYLNRGRTKD